MYLTLNYSIFDYAQSSLIEGILMQIAGVRATHARLCKRLAEAALAMLHSTLTKGTHSTDYTRASATASFGRKHGFARIHRPPKAPRSREFQMEIRVLRPEAIETYCESGRKRRLSPKDTHQISLQDRNAQYPVPGISGRRGI